MEENSKLHSFKKVATLSFILILLFSQYFTYQIQAKNDDNFSTRYFEVLEDSLTVYDNSTGKLIPVGTLEKGQVYPIVSDYGNWHRIQFHNQYGYVLKSSTRQASGGAIKNENKGYKPSGRMLTAKEDIDVYDNSSGKLVRFATLNKGSRAPILSNYGNWWRIEVSNRVGYVHKKDVQVALNTNDRYFEMLEDNLTVFDNSTGKLIPVGKLEKGQVYPRVNDYGNWHRIQFHNQYGYVLKSATNLASSTAIKNENKEYKPSGRMLTSNKDILVYDNTSGKLVPFATLNKGIRAPILSDYGNWWRVEVSNRVGYIHKNDVQIAFTANDRYFEVLEENLTVYDNSTGKLVPVGTLKKDQVYPRVSDYGNWHRIQFHNQYGYVQKSSTRPVIGSRPKNENLGKYKHTGRSLTALKDVEVYDNSTGKLIPFVFLNKGTRASVVSDYGNWWRVEVSGLIGYVRKSEVEVTFMNSDRYFEVLEENLTIYDNRTGELVPIGSFEKGQVYQRISDYGNWHRIKYHNHYGYVRKTSTRPAKSGSVKNKSTGSETIIATFIISKDTPVYDNSSGSLKQIATLKQGKKYSTIKDYGNWWTISIAGRIGYIHKSNVSNLQWISRNIVNPKQKYSYDQMQKDITLLRKTYPGLIQTRVIGKSVDGRDITAIKLGKGTTEVLLNASHHAREHMTTNVLMEMIDVYAAGYQSNQKFGQYNVKTTLDRVSIWFVPMVNPDGVMLVQHGYMSTSNPNQVIKINNGSKNFNAWKANIRGVDLNRQYPELWNTIRDNPGKPAPANYKGSRPLIEPEVKALHSFTLSRNFKSAVAYHSSGNVIFARFGHEGFTRSLANIVSRETGYSPIDLTKDLSGGGYTDWFIRGLKKPGLTVEISPPVGNRPVPLANWDSIWNKNKAVGLAVAHEAYLNRNRR